MPDAIYSPTLKRVSVVLADEILVKRDIDDGTWKIVVAIWLNQRGFRRANDRPWRLVGEGYRCEVISQAGPAVTETWPFVQTTRRKTAKVPGAKKSAISGRARGGAARARELHHLRRAR